jgi:acetyl esterase/lipase
MAWPQSITFPELFMLRFLLAMIALICTLPFALAADPPPKIYLWEKGAPGFEDRKDEKEIHDQFRPNGEYRTTNIHNQYVTVFLPPKEKATRAAVVVVSGGGHRELWMKQEGENVAEWLADHGIAAVVLRYRLARETGSPYKVEIHATQDGQRALRLVRSKAKEWNIDPNRVGMIGFSAGGEVVARVCRKAEKGDDKAEDPIERESAFPSFQALVYSGGGGIRNETITKANAPPSFLLVGDDDGAAATMVTHYQALKKAGVPSELHVYAKTGHAFGYRPGKMNKAPVDTWPDLFYAFLGTQGMLKKS